MAVSVLQDFSHILSLSPGKSLLQVFCSQVEINVAIGDLATNQREPCHLSSYYWKMNMIMGILSIAKSMGTLLNNNCEYG